MPPQSLDTFANDLKKKDGDTNETHITIHQCNIRLYGLLNILQEVHTIANEQLENMLKNVNNAQELLTARLHYLENSHKHPTAALLHTQYKLAWAINMLTNGSLREDVIRDAMITDKELLMKKKMIANCQHDYVYTTNVILNDDVTIQYKQNKTTEIDSFCSFGRLMNNDDSKNIKIKNEKLNVIIKLFQCMLLILTTEPGNIDDIPMPIGKGLA